MRQYSNARNITQCQRMVPTPPQSVPLRTPCIALKQQKKACPQDDYKAA